MGWIDLLKEAVIAVIVSGLIGGLLKALWTKEVTVINEKFANYNKRLDKTDEELKRQSERTHSLTSDMSAIKVNVEYIKEHTNKFDNKLEDFGKKIDELKK